jgi:hypothetical protein
VQSLSVLIEIDAIYYSLNKEICYQSEIQDNKIVIIDSELTFEEACGNQKISEAVRNNLTLVDVEYYSLDNSLHRGQILIHKTLAKDIIEIFEVIKKEKFPIGKALPVSIYDWSDSASMLDNNTSALNFRYVKGTKILSSHAEGRAIDVNPLLNPQIKKGKVYPIGAEYNPKIPGTITKESFLVKEFKKRGWSWGGDWQRSKDYQHFEKRNK